VDILAGRTAEPVAQWISQHPGVEIVARDRATAYAQAVSSTAPGAIQVADRFHLVRNVNDAFREVIDGRCWVIPGIAVDTVPEPCAKKPECPTRSELARLVAATRLEDRYEEVWRLFHEGKSIRAISRATGLCRVTVRKYLQHTEVPRRAPRPQVPGKITPFIGYLKQRWEAGCHNASRPCSVTLFWRRLPITLEPRKDHIPIRIHYGAGPQPKHGVGTPDISV
jgi:hypothetical protein